MSLELPQKLQHRDVVRIKFCTHCGSSYQPKLKGYNAKYCSETCKTRSRRKQPYVKRPYDKDARRFHYIRTKDDPVRLEIHRSSSRRYRDYGREWLAAYKLEKGCVDCGYRAHSAALQLDHEGVKSVEIAEARSSIARLQREIEEGQCMVRCANCHSVKTWERKRDARITRCGEN